MAIAVSQDESLVANWLLELAYRPFAEVIPFCNEKAS